MGKDQIRKQFIHRKGPHCVMRAFYFIYNKVKRRVPAINVSFTFKCCAIIYPHPYGMEPPSYMFI